MIRCPNCGNENPPGSRFCANCGRRLPEPTAPEPASAPPISAPPTNASQPATAPPVNPTDLPPTHPEWRMSPPEPYEPRHKRRTWLWIALGIIAVCLVVCVALIVFVNTPPGRSFIATQAALQATPTASSATSAP
ncbi:MAG TPA: zinc-ribbon domain-containing protein [Thermomicrobiales bacterium]|nr:zinc-ribbon domain-containing protein [Thermomicrobiales bacterium]